jgi:predicted RNA-binding Zn-ribbon protein involved in translation (DUF1610 family)
LARYWLAYWAACVEATGGDDSVAAAAALDAANPSIEAVITALFDGDDHDALSGAVADVIYAGLVRRTGLYLDGVMGDLDLRLLRYLQELGGFDVGEFPDRPASATSGPRRLHVCRTCSIVFEPARKAVSAVCPDCHARPHRDPPARIINLTAPDGAPAWKFTGVPGSQPGYRRLCAICGDFFEASRSNARVCAKPTCRRTHSRRINRAHGL